MIIFRINFDDFFHQKWDIYIPPIEFSKTNHSMRCAIKKYIFCEIFMKKFHLYKKQSKKREWSLLQINEYVSTLFLHINISWTLTLAFSKFFKNPKTCFCMRNRVFLDRTLIFRMNFDNFSYKFLWYFYLHWVLGSF